MPNGVKIQITEKIKSGVCKEVTKSWKDICDMVINPERLPQGREAKLWSFYVLKGNIGEYGLLQGNKDNVHSVIAMQIDYDDGVTTIDSFCKRFSEYTFVLYTSKSHSDACHKFRVVMPLRKPMLGEVYASKSSREHLKTIFTGCDKTTFDAWRKQRIPHTSDKTIKYEYRINKGGFYELDNELLTSLYIADKQKYNSCGFGSVSIDIDPFNSTLDEIYEAGKLKGLIDYYSEELNSINWLKRSSGEDVHSRSRRCIYALRMNGMGSDDVYSLVMGYAPSQLRKEMYDLCYGEVR